MSTTIQALRLGDIAHARSGDKGSSANVGVIAYTLEGFSFLQESLTEWRVAENFKPLGPTKVTRYELPNLGALNFVLEGILAGGGSRSLRVDAQGKALVRNGIVLFGSYTWNISIGTTTANTTVNVTAAAGTCPP